MRQVRIELYRTFFINQSDCGELCIRFDPYSFLEINNFFLIYSIGIVLDIIFVTNLFFVRVGGLSFLHKILSN